MSAILTSFDSKTAITSSKPTPPIPAKDFLQLADMQEKISVENHQKVFEEVIATIRLRSSFKDDQPVITTSGFGEYDLRDSTANTYHNENLENFNKVFLMIEAKLDNLFDQFLSKKYGEEGLKFYKELQKKLKPLGSLIENPPAELFDQIINEIEKHYDSTTANAFVQKIKKSQEAFTNTTSALSHK